jgi:hypothetical protein
MSKLDKFPAGSRRSQLSLLLLGLASLILWAQWNLIADREILLVSNERPALNAPDHANSTLALCKRLKLSPGPPDDFTARKVNDRFVLGTRPTLLKNATIWTGNNDGFEILHYSDILLDKGLIHAIGDVGYLPEIQTRDMDSYDLNGAWVTPG